MMDSGVRRRRLLATAGMTVVAPLVARAQGEPIRIGEINSYTAQPAFLQPYRNAWILAQEQVNAAGGIHGRPLETLFRDDAGRPEDAVRLAGELVNAEKVALLSGGFLSNVGLAIGDFANQNKRLFVASEPLTDALVWARGNRYTFRLRASTYMQSAMLVEEAAKLPVKRWATVAPNYEYGQSAVRWFKELLTRAKPDVQFVAEQFPALGRIDAGATVQALAAANPEAIFNVTFGADLTNFVRQGSTRGLFERRRIVSLLTGEPEYLEPLQDEAPEGWIVTGYPWDQINTPEHSAFRDAYRRRWNDHPRLGSVVGYDTVMAIATMLKKIPAPETEAMVAAMRGLPFGSVFGPAEFRAIDHQSTMGAFVGRTALKNGKGTMVDWRYADGRNYLPPDEVVRTLRPQG
ncbi:twin-arginine translocation pathway signal protein [Siccirubricoccus deserti]|uniref:ABC transporter substrate-binding protein n=1 Tax=Siccirubricoccus deserti TaxID=2013562 RepID=A0A9X0QYB4_9PROT|nr:ABC transporter substrate-binding protein [Siccirubricoccus deserti]MBC4016221.1 ABC transporter substrate-binding protein [Siccirubricoccus deserti]GGC48164.1 twin-arginine translocation pathway signal protein [Siccirubricoccus deserti]